MMSPVSSHEVFRCLLLRNRVRLQVGPRVATTYEYPLSKRTLRAERTRQGQQAHQIPELHCIRDMFSLLPSGTRESSRFRRTSYFVSYHTSCVTYQILDSTLLHRPRQGRVWQSLSTVYSKLIRICMERFHKRILINCLISSLRTMWSVCTILTRIHSAAGFESTLKWVVVSHKLLLHVRPRLFLAKGSNGFHARLKHHPWKSLQIQLSLSRSSLCVTHTGHRCTLQWTRWHSWLHSRIDCTYLLTSSLIREYNERPCPRSYLELHALSVQENSLLRSCAVRNAVYNDYSVIDNAENTNTSEEQSTCPRDSITLITYDLGLFPSSLSCSMEKRETHVYLINILSEEYEFWTHHVLGESHETAVVTTSVTSISSLKTNLLKCLSRPTCSDIVRRITKFTS